MNHEYHWIHLPTGLRGSTRWDSLCTFLSDYKKHQFINEWNRVAMIGRSAPTYHYWM